MFVDKNIVVRWGIFVKIFQEFVSETIGNELNDI